MEAFGPPTISKAKFAEVLAGSPVLIEWDAAVYYATIVDYGIDPCFMLAIFKHESDCARNPAAAVNRYDTKNWGNTRSLSLKNALTPPLPTIIQTDRGPFVKFLGWLIGLLDACNRLVSPDYPYAKAGARQVETIIPIWAPSGDMDNRPTAYIASVLLNMSKWKDISPMAGLTIHEAFIPWGNSNRPGTKLTGGKPRFITVHETGNPKAGANALMHRNFSHGRGGWGGGGYPASSTQQEYEGVSFHYTVDDKEAYHLLPDDEKGYHAGDGLAPGSGGSTSIAIETCINSDGNWGRTILNLATLVTTLMARHDIPLTNVVQHNRWSGKDCPHRLRTGEAWTNLLTAVNLAKAPARPPRPEGWIGVDQADMFEWEGAGIIVYRKVRFYNPEEKRYYEREWDGEGGFTPWQEVI